jgi:hypothetical protein
VIDTHATDTLLGALNLALSQALNTGASGEQDDQNKQSERVALRASALVSPQP